MDQPSEAQIKAGNYPKGHTYAHGMRISIENPADSVRSGVDENGEPWDSRMQHDYGYIRGTEGADGDHVDVFLGPEYKDRDVPVHVIDQHDKAGKFDEHKVMMGFRSKDEALRAYMGNYPDGHTGARAIVPMHVDDFKDWVFSGKAKKSVSKAKKFADGGTVNANSEDYGKSAPQQGPWWDQSPVVAAKPEAAPISFEQYRAKISPNMLGADGTFKAPSAGVNFMLEGLTPEQAYTTATHKDPQWMERDGYDPSTAFSASSQMLDPSWRPGPDNGGGFLGGLARAVGGLATGIAHNPALMSAITAGVINPAVNSGLRSAGMSAATANTVTPLVTSAGRTILGGGSLADAAKGAGTTYLGGQAGNAVSDVTGLSVPVSTYIAQHAITGKKGDPFGLAAAFAQGEQKPRAMADGGYVPLAERNKGYAKDFEHTNKVLGHLVRGWAAGTAGLPGDLEHLARKVVGWGASEGTPIQAWSKGDPVLPTSEFFKEWLPGHSDDARLQAADDAGSLFGGVGAGTVAKPLAKGAGALTKAIAEAAPGPVAGGPRAMRGVIKAPGGNWLNGSVENALKSLKQLDIQGTNPPTPLNQFIDKQLTRYVKNDMATERDPIRALAEQGVLHVDPEALNFKLDAHGKYMQPGQTAVAKGHSAKAWEGASDLTIGSDTASGIQNNFGGNGPLRKSISGSKILSDNSWLSKVEPDTQVYMPSTKHLSDDLGFNHLIDELRNATNPQSGLPAHLMLDPKSLDRVSVPDAVRRVAAINEWRAAQKAEANQALANNAATVLHKEYPENNPKGLHWVELKAPARNDEALAKAAREVGIEPGSLEFEGFAPSRYKSDARRDLESALKYEGDTMGHCVGGYCDDVASGVSRIFSLRDAKGQPHVTIETRPGRLSGKMNIEDWAASYEKNHGEGSSAAYLAEHPEIEQAFVPEVVQIKGKANQKPNDEYLPFVQDFVKSGKWSDVGDLRNTGLRKTSDAWNANELKKIQDAGIEVPRFASQPEIDAIGNTVWPGQWGAAQ